MQIHLQQLDSQVFEVIQAIHLLIVRLMKKRYYLIRLGKSEQVIKKALWELGFLKQVQNRDEVSES